MRRILLAFLALLGFAAQVQPAQARACRVQEIGVVAPAGVIRAQAGRTAVISQSASGGHARGAGCHGPVTAGQPVPVAAVLIGIDRAHE